MNKFLIGVIIGLTVPLTAIAGEHGGTPDSAGFDKHHVQRMMVLTQELGLTTEQQSKVAAIFEEQKGKFKAIHEETKTRLQTVLSPTQMQKMAEIHGRHHGGAPDAMPENK
jgi:hypothetical protein